MLAFRNILSLLDIIKTIVKVFCRVWFSSENGFTTLMIELPIRDMNVLLLLNGCLVQSGPASRHGSPGAGEIQEGRERILRGEESDV